MRFLSVLVVVALLHYLLLNLDFKKERVEIEESKKEAPLNLFKYNLTPPKVEPKVVKKPPPPKKNIERVKQSLQKTSKEIIETKESSKTIPQKSEKEVIEIAQETQEESEENLSKLISQSLKRVENLHSQLKKTQESESILNFLSKPQSKREIVNFKEKPLKELYKDEWENLSKEEREFLKSNLSKIGFITQQYLEYPRVAGEMGQEGVNVIEFYLYPNGDISDLKLIDSSGYSILDENSKETIEIAYKDYPKPSKRVKIRIYTHYSIYGF